MATSRVPTPDIMGAVLAAKPDAAEKIALFKIHRDGGTQMRAGLDEATVAEYFEAMSGPNAWGFFPPLVVFYDGVDYWLADGFHRYAAAIQAFGASYSAPCDVRAGTQRDAMLHAASANASHGLRRTNADKRRAVLALLQDPEWSQWSDGEIAKRCAVSQPFVSGLRKDHAPERHSVIVQLPDAPDEDEGETTHNGYESPAPATAPITRKGSDGREYKVKPATPVYEPDGWRLDKQDESTWVAINDTLKVETTGYNTKREAVSAIYEGIYSESYYRIGAGRARAAAPAPAPVSLANGKNLVDWTDEDWEAAKVKVVSAETQAANQARATEAGELIDLYQRVIDSEAAYSRLTGDFVGTIAMKDALSKMQAGLKRLKEDLS